MLTLLLALLTIALPAPPMGAEPAPHTISRPHTVRCAPRR